MTSILIISMTLKISKIRMIIESESLNKINILGIFPYQCLCVAEEQGIDISIILNKYGFSSIKQIAEICLDFKLMQDLMTDTWDVFPNETTGFIAGIRLPPTAYGSLGQGVLSSVNLRDALNFVQKYWDLIGRGIYLDIKTTSQMCSITLTTERVVQPFLERWMVESAIATLWRFLMIVMPAEKKSFQVCFKFSQPKDLKIIQTHIPNLVYNFPVTQLNIPVKLLEKLFPLSSELGLKQATKQCDIQLKKLRQVNLFSEQVRKLLGISAHGFPSLEQASTLLSISSRTLRKKLHLENSNYSNLLQEARLLNAIELLNNPNLSIGDIAELLGYQDEANFCRAFKRWTQQTPTDIRKTIKSGNLDFINISYP